MSENPIPDFSRVYRDYHAAVHQWAARLAGRDLADDVTQEVFVKAGRALPTLADSAKLGAWLHAITVNTVRDLARKSAARGERLRPSAVATADGDAPAARIESPGTGPRTPEEIAIRDEMVACYLEFVSRLPGVYYDVYSLSEFEHLSNDEIARRLSLPVGTVKMRLHRARHRVTEALRSHCQPCRDARGELMGERKDR